MNAAKRVLFVVCGLLLGSSLAYAGGVPLNHNAINANLGFSPGGADLGVSYEYGYASTYSVGAYVRVIPDTTSGMGQNGLTTFGAFIRPHFSKANWDFYVSPGFGFVSYKYAGSGKSYTTLGPSFGVGLLYELTPTMSVGAEQKSIYGWWNINASGLLNADTTASFRFIF